MKVDQSDPNGSNHAIEAMLATFAKTGKGLEMNHARANRNGAAKTAFNELLQRVDSASACEKGTAPERLVSALFASVPKFMVKSKLRALTEQCGAVFSHTIACQSFPHALSAVRSGSFAAILPKLALTELAPVDFVVIH